jgi:hypothetical protein
MNSKLLIILSFLSLCFCQAYAQTKHALLVGVGIYPNRTIGSSWSDLSSKNDIDLVKSMLLGQKFEAKNIVEILDEKAMLNNKHYNELHGYDDKNKTAQINFIKFVFQ